MPPNAAPAEWHVLRTEAERFAAAEIAPAAALHDRTGRFPEAVCRTAWTAGWVNLGLPWRAGGPGLGPLEMLHVAAAFAQACAGITEALLASEPALAALGGAGGDAGAEVFAAVTEPLGFAAWADARPPLGGRPAVTLRRAGGEYVLSGTLPTVRNGARAAWLLVPAAPEDSAGRRPEATALALVPGDAPGLEREPISERLGLRAAEAAAVCFRNVRLPKGRIVEDPAAARAGRQRRALGLAAVACGLMRRALREAAAYAQVREQFGRPLAAYEAIQAKLADMAVTTEAAWALAERAARASNAARPAAAHAAALFAGEGARAVTSEAVQVLGGYGYMEDYPTAKLLRDAKALALEAGLGNEHRWALAAAVLGGEEMGR